MTADNPAARVDLDALAKLLAAATPGPWQHFGDHLVWPSDQGPAANDPICATGDAHDDFDAGEFPNAALIAAAVNALPDLLAELRDAREALAKRAGAHERTRQSLRRMALRMWALTDERDEARAALEAGDACGAVGCRALAERDALRKRVDALVGTLRKQAGLEFDRHGPHDPRGAAFWDVAAWVEETALADPEAS